MKPDAPFFPYSPALDGLRGVAILAVVGFHGGYLAGGYFGVDVFFTLSGFLITSILLKEHITNSRIDVLRFYRRRALRLFPALVVVIVAAGLFETLTTACPVGKPFPTRAFYSLTFFSNWLWAFGDNTNHMCGFYALWSLAIEEQFYIIWPLILVWLFRRKNPIKTTAATLAIMLSVAFLWRIYLWNTGATAWRIGAGTDTRADALLIGCLVAIAGYAAPREFWEARKRLIAFAAPFAFLALAVLRLNVSSPAPDIFPLVFPLAGALSALVLVGVAIKPVAVLAGALAFPPLVYIGKISYGIYLWHGVVGTYADMHFPGLWYSAELAIVAAATLMSYYFVELPFLRLKDRTFLLRRSPVSHGETLAT